ncbi:MAG TPA: 4-hydroxyphenylacetate 3-hydroxylase N-terminal domain-containing protein, partial [Candidatus Dormibacteraeota bacterium]|nr:4-hydroxyphenylacetate 3-hydroxylase N-terminal domain-containing protein [Candidatus Dormibacteraeota bacterium]
MPAGEWTGAVGGTSSRGLHAAARVCEIARMRRGADYLASLRDGRAIFLDGRRIDDVTGHPAFAQSVRRIAERYDAARGAPDVTTCVDPAGGGRIGAMWLIPRSAEDLGRRRAVHRFWAEG